MSLFIDIIRKNDNYSGCYEGDHQSSAKTYLQPQITSTRDTMTSLECYCICI